MTKNSLENFMYSECLNNPAKICALAAAFKTLGNPVRLRILQALQGGSRTISQLAADTQQNQANTSKHVHILAYAGIISRTWRPTKVVRTANPFFGDVLQLIVVMFDERAEDIPK